mmetsp:Transcript_39141/g.99164  ORF Transcript_39141/g.99164 Transcript_39141/m.99164 type:complete len:268 (+) Transcript_39141:1214-2017(+)
MRAGCISRPSAAAAAAADERGQPASARWSCTQGPLTGHPTACGADTGASHRAEESAAAACRQSHARAGPTTEQRGGAHCEDDRSGGGRQPPSARAQGPAALAAGAAVWAAAGAAPAAGAAAGAADGPDASQAGAEPQPGRAVGGVKVHTGLRIQPGHATGLAGAAGASRCTAGGASPLHVGDCHPGAAPGTRPHRGAAQPRRRRHGALRVCRHDAGRWRRAAAGRLPHPPLQRTRLRGGACARRDGRPRGRHGGAGHWWPGAASCGG